MLSPALDVTDEDLLLVARTRLLYVYGAMNEDQTDCHH